MPEETEDQQNPTVEDPSQEDAQQEEQEPSLPKFGFASEDIGTLKKKVTITVPRERIGAKLDDMFGELGQTAQVPGFRIGHAPRRLVEKRFGKEVSRDVRNALVGEALGEVLEEADFRTLGEPDLDLESIEVPETGEMEFSFEVEVAPEFELPTLEGIPVEKRAFEVTDERITEYIDELRRGRAQFEETDEPAADGDVVIADTRVSGDEIENPAEAKEQTLRVAPGQVEGIPLVDLGKELTGKKIGDTVTMTAKIPEAHPNEEWRGKQATVEVTLGKVRRRILPELNEEFVRGAGFDSLEELRSFVRERMQQRVESETTRSMRDQVCQHLLDHTEFELPEGVASRHAARTLQRRYVDLLMRGVPREQIDENMTELKASTDEQAARDLKLQFIIGKAAELQEITVEEGEVNSRIASMAAARGRRPERVRQELEQEGNLGQVEVQIIEEKVLDKLLEQAKVTEVTEPEPEAADSDKTSDAK
jgi:trigger factor